MVIEEEGDGIDLDFDASGNIRIDGGWPEELWISTILQKIPSTVSLPAGDGNVFLFFDKHWAVYERTDATQVQELGYSTRMKRFAARLFLSEYGEQR